jgi:siroheme synthase-like protein
VAIDAPLYPVGLVVAGRRVLVVGGGEVARQKVAELVGCGAAVHVVSLELIPALRDDPAVTFERRAYRRGEVEGYRLVVAATGDPAVNQAVHDDAEAAGIWVNAADDPDRCTVVLPARLRRGPVLITASTAGRSPALASWLRDRIAVDVGDEVAELAELLAEARSELRDAGLTTEGLDWRGALESGMLEMVREGRLVEAKERLQACLSSSSG